MGKIRAFSETVTTGRPGTTSGVAHGQTFINFHNNVAKVIKAIPTMTKSRIRDAVNRARSNETLSKVDEQIMKIFGPVGYLPHPGYRKTRLEKD